MGKMENKQTAIIVVLVAILILACIAFSYVFLSQNPETIQINDLNIKQDQFGIYQLEGHITPQKDYAYMEARIVFYDENGTIIGKAPCAWNMRDLEKDSKISVGNGIGAVVDETPAYAVVSFYDDVRSTDALANFTVDFDGTTNKSDDSNASSNAAANNNNANNNGDNKYTQQDVDKARREGYQNGYTDSHSEDTSSNNIHENSQVETTTDSSSSSQSSSSSSSSNVETTTG